MKPLCVDEIFSRSTRGLVRPENQDRFLVKRFSRDMVLLAVADGMGGEANGGLAAQTVVDVLERFAPCSGNCEEQLAALLEEAGNIILEIAAENAGYLGMGSTAVAVFIQNGNAFWANLGDSRLYLFRNKSLVQVSKDHTFIQELLDAGDMTPEEARNSPLRHALEHCVGVPDSIPDTGSFPLLEGDALLLCSDGLHGYLPASLIVSALSMDASLRERGEQLIKFALGAGGKDNITVCAAGVAPCP